MAIYQPYFYVIQDIRNGMYYAGAKWAQGCHPDQLLKENGYPTSSETIKEIIDENGLEAFVIRKIRTFETGLEAYDYETRFLRKVDARNHPRFYNGHNNDGKFDQAKMKIVMMELYGVDHFSKTSEYKEQYKNTCLDRYGVEAYPQSDDFKEKYKNTCLDRYGADHYWKTDDFKEKYKDTCLEKYGVDHHLKSEVCREKGKQTNISVYGVEHYSQTDMFKEQYKNTCLDRYGADHYWKTDEGREKIKDTMIEKYGVEAYPQSEEYKEKSIQTSLSKYGTEYYSQTDMFKEQYRDTCLERYGVDHPSKTEEHKRSMVENNPTKRKDVVDKIRDKKKNTFIGYKNMDTISAERAAETMKKEFINDRGEVMTIYKENGKKLSNTMLQLEANGKTKAYNKNKNTHKKLRQKGKWYKVLNVFDDKFSVVLPAADVRKISPGLESKTIDNYVGMVNSAKGKLIKKGKSDLIGLYCERIQ